MPPDTPAPLVGQGESAPSTGDRALVAQYTVAEFIAYLQRVGYHEIAERVSRDRQIIVIGRRI